MRTSALTPIRRVRFDSLGTYIRACGVVLACSLSPLTTHAATTVAADPANNMIDATDYSALGAGTGYWFANFGNPVAVTGDAMNSFEASNIPPWIHLDTNPANIGKDDSGAVNDTSAYTGFSFTDSLPISSSTGGQTPWNFLTLPDGTFGLSGAAVDTANASNNTNNWVHMRILPGAPSMAQMWVVTDNWGGGAVNADPNSRLRVRTKLLDASFMDIGDISQVDTVPGSPLPNNGMADAYAFMLTDITPGDGLVIRITSGAAPSHGSIAGVMFKPIPEPSSVLLLGLGAIGAGLALWRRRLAGTK